MKRLFIAMLATVGAAAITPAVWAGPLTPITINEPGFSLSGKVSHIGGNAWLMTGIDKVSMNFSDHPGFDFHNQNLQVIATGQSFGGTLHLDLVAAGGYDDKVFTSQVNPFDSHGILLEITGGADKNDYLWIFVSGGQVESELFSHTGARLAGGGYGSFSLSNGAHGLVMTPEPSSLFLLGTGLLLLAVMLFWKRRHKMTTEIPAKIARIAA